MGSTTGYDYVTIKLNSSGTTQWSHTYDYTSLSDLPGYIAWNSGSSKVGIAGASQSSATNWDYTTIKYNSAGTLTNTNRSSATGYGFDRPTGLVTDNSGNFYITGNAYNGTDYDMRTIKLDDDLSPLWTRTDDGDAEDGSNAICRDGSNNIYIAGFTVSEEGNKLMKIIKYNSSGTLQWENTIQNMSNEINAEATAITYNSTSSRVIVTGYYEYTSGKKSITTFGLDVSDGDLAWKKDFPNLNASIDEPTQIFENSTHIWVQARRTVDDTSRYLTIKYEYWDRDLEPIEDEVNNITYLENQVILKFNPDLVDIDFVNNRQRVYDNLENIIPDSVYDAIIPLIEGEGQFTARAVKVYKRLTANDTLSITRQGDTIPIPPFWATLVVTTNVDPVDILDTLNNLPAIIQSANLNVSIPMETLPDDIQVEQESLVNTLTGGEDEDINYEGAYTIEQGKSIVRVGVYDTGIYWAHKDFGESGSASESVVTDGYDYPNGYAYYEDNNDDTKSWRHGTQVASIIGAISNNGFGIA